MFVVLKKCGNAICRSGRHIAPLPFFFHHVSSICAPLLPPSTSENHNLVSSGTIFSTYVVFPPSFGCFKPFFTSSYYPVIQTHGSLARKIDFHILDPETTDCLIGNHSPLYLEQLVICILGTIRFCTCKK